MNELIALVSQRSGLSPEDAQKAVEAVLDVLKEKLPAPMASHLQAFIDGGMQGGLGTVEGEAGELLKGKLGDMLGGMLSGQHLNH
jgi:uncharacterized protein (DUF2267 family)